METKTLRTRKRIALREDWSLAALQLATSLTDDEMEYVTVRSFTPKGSGGRVVFFNVKGNEVHTVDQLNAVNGGVLFRVSSPIIPKSLRHERKVIIECKT